jgi:hypothetical protein
VPSSTAGGSAVVWMKPGQLFTSQSIGARDPAT